MESSEDGEFPEDEENKNDKPKRGDFEEGRMR